MKFSILFVLLLLKTSWCQTSGNNRIACGSVRNQTIVAYLGLQKTCYIGGEVLINRRDFQLSHVRDDTVRGLVFDSNKKISYAPIFVNEIFPNLITWSSSSNPIQSLSRENFRDMKNLRVLILFDGKIEKIYSDTFQDVTALEQLDLRKKILFNFVTILIAYKL